ncbi:hypothetical protein BLOT_015759 [Blomia tropicalis]|nr:hypothetical protein BLOT_015759 [Blomia tropicalis]
MLEPMKTFSTLVFQIQLVESGVGDVLEVSTKFDLLDFRFFTLHPCSSQSLGIGNNIVRLLRPVKAL